MNMTFVLPSRNVRVEEDVSRSEEVENTTFGLVEEEPSVAPFEVGDSAGQTDMQREVEKSSQTTATGLAVMAGLYRPLELKKEDTDSRIVT